MNKILESSKKNLNTTDSSNSCDNDESFEKRIEKTKKDASDLNNDNNN